MVRFKCRYLLVEVTFPASLASANLPELNEGLIVTIIRDSLKVNFGDLGWAKIGGSLNSRSRLGLNSDFSVARPTRHLQSNTYPTGPI